MESKSQPVLRLTTTGLSAEERDKVVASVGALAATLRIEYDADLTSHTTHLLAPTAHLPHSKKLSFARAAAIPVLKPEWIHDSARHGSLLPLVSEYLHTVTPLPALAHADNTIVRDPLTLIAAAHAAGELPAAIAEDQVVKMGAHTFHLDATTDFARGTSFGGLPLRSADGGSIEYYTLRQLLFALACRSLAHTDYFLACIRSEPYIAPVLMNDKKALFARVDTHGVSDAREAVSSSPLLKASHKLQQGPLAPTTMHALADGRATSSRPSSHGAKSEPSPAEAQLLQQISQLHELLRAQRAAPAVASAS